MRRKPKHRHTYVYTYITLVSTAFSKKYRDNDDTFILGHADSLMAEQLIPSVIYYKKKLEEKCLIKCDFPQVLRLKLEKSQQH